MLLWQPTTPRVPSTDVPTPTSKSPPSSHPFSRCSRWRTGAVGFSTDLYKGRRREIKPRIQT